MKFDNFDTQGFHLEVVERRRLEDAYRDSPSTSRRSPKAG